MLNEVNLGEKVNHLERPCWGKILARNMASKE